MVFENQKRKKWAESQNNDKGKSDNPRSISYIQGEALLEEKNVTREMTFNKMLQGGMWSQGHKDEDSSRWTKQVMPRLDRGDWLVSEYHTQTLQ